MKRANCKSKIIWVRNIANLFKKYYNKTFNEALKFYNNIIIVKNATNKLNDIVYLNRLYYLGLKEVDLYQKKYLSSESYSMSVEKN